MGLITELVQGQYTVSRQEFADYLQGVETWNLSKRDYHNSDILEPLEDNPLSDHMTPDEKSDDMILKWLDELEEINEEFEYLIGYSGCDARHGLTFTLSDDTVTFEIYSGAENESTNYSAGDPLRGQLGD